MAGQGRPIVGLDHVPLAVRDIDRAVETYRRLGFSIKPGRFHANGIRNAHVKFSDGSGLELITATEAVDPLTTRYRALLALGEGPAFLALHARDSDRLIAALRRGYEFDRRGDLTEIRQPGLEWLFVVRDNRSPTDRPEHFDHQNGAVAFQSIWIATDAREGLVRLLADLGGARSAAIAAVPEPSDAIVVKLDGGDVVILPASHQRVVGRPVIGASVLVRDLEVVRRHLAMAGIEFRHDAGEPRRVVVAPAQTLGLWLEFRQDSEAR